MKVPLPYFKLRMVATGLILTGVYVVMMNLEFLQNPGAGSSAARSMPAWQFWGIMITVFAFVVLMQRVLWHDIPKEGVYTRELARKISGERWYVKGMSVWENDVVRNLDASGWEEHANTRDVGRGDDAGTIILRLTSVDKRRDRTTIPFPPQHPSTTHIRNLTYLSEIGFEFRHSPLDCGANTDLCSYLVLKAN